jgi:putative drug exporter of the RND superfamily
MHELKETEQPSLLARWARFAARHHWRVLGVWLAALVILGVASATLGGEYVNTFELPGSDSQEAVDLLQARFPAASGDSASIVFQDEAGVTDPAVQARIEGVLSEAATLPEVVAVTSPYQDPAQVSADGTIAYATVQYDKSASDVDKAAVDQLFDLVDASGGNGLRVEAGGQVVTAQEIVPPGTSEFIGIAVAMVIMLLMFGSVIAMGLPIMTALVGLGIGILVAPLFANGFTLSASVTDAFLSMMGLGVGIDYALFIVNRYRDGLLDGKSVEDAVVRAIDTSGRAIIFAGVTVAITLLGLTAIGIPFITGLGLAGAIVVIASVIVAIFLIPAILGLVGNRVLRWRIPGLGGAARGEDSFWFRWGRRIQARPGIFGAAVVLVLLVIATPFFDMRLGLSDAGNNPTSMHSRRAYDLMAEGFGPGANGPLLIVVEQSGGIDSALLQSLPPAIQTAPDVAAVTAATPNQAGDTAIFQVIPASSPQDRATTDLVNHLRDDVIPDALGGSTAHAYVAGSTAANIDLSAKISEQMPLFFAIVIGLSVLLLIVVFRTVVVPLKAAVLNLLSVGAAFGAVVAVFQYGWFKDVLGVAKEGPVEAFLPILLFGIVFGLSMDYEVFLLSRVHEEHSHGRPARRAMLDGVGYSGKVVAAAGAIMTSVFLAFVLGDSRVIKELGFGVGFAIIVDAFLVRLVLVPAIITLLGDRAWYMPAWLDWILPRFNVEGAPDPDVDYTPPQLGAEGASVRGAVPIGR